MQENVDCLKISYSNHREQDEYVFKLAYLTIFTF